MVQEQIDDWRARPRLRRSSGITSNKKDNELAQHRHNAEVERYLFWTVQRRLEELQTATNGGLRLPWPNFGARPEDKRRRQDESPRGQRSERLYSKAARSSAADRWFDANVKDEERFERCAW